MWAAIDEPTCVCTLIRARLHPLRGAAVSSAWIRTCLNNTYLLPFSESLPDSLLLLRDLDWATVAGASSELLNDLSSGGLLYSQMERQSCWASYITRHFLASWFQINWYQLCVSAYESLLCVSAAHPDFSFFSFSVSSRSLSFCTDQMLFKSLVSYSDSTIESKQGSDITPTGRHSLNVWPCWMKPGWSCGASLWRKNENKEVHMFTKFHQTTHKCVIFIQDMAELRPTE